MAGNGMMNPRCRSSPAQAFFEFHHEGAGAAISRPGKDMIATIKRHLAIRRLKRLVKPNPDYARRCAAQLPPKRRERFLRAVRGVLS